MSAPVEQEIVSPFEPISTEETALARRAEDSFLRRMENIENAAALFQKRTELLETAHLVAIRRTRPEDWVLFKMKDGSETAMLTASGADLVADVYGIQIANIRPIDHRGVFDPEKVPVTGKSGVYTLRAWCDARSSVTGREVQSLEASRRSDEDFTGRSVDANDGLTFRGVGALESDLRSACQTLLRTKAVRVLCGMTRVPVSDLARAWKDTGKAVEQCRKGSGYGTSQERTAEKVADAGIPEQGKALWSDILKLTGGDEDAAGQVLREITSYPAGSNARTGRSWRAFTGVTSVAGLTTQRHIDSARERLAKHELSNAQAPDDRQPGEE